MIRNQWQGLFRATRAGLVVKVNTVYIPGVNDAEIPLVAQRAGSLGVHVMNILPLIPQAQLSHLKRPDHKMLTAMRDRCRPSVSQMTHCRQCRADACGTLEEDKDAELEVLLARIGEEYSEVV